MPLDFTDLREMKKRQDIEGLLNVLETGDIMECQEAIYILGELKVRKAINPLIELLETDDIQIRSNAAWALGEIVHPRSVLPLIGLLNDPIENVRINAAWSLGRIGDKRALSALRSAMNSGSDELRKHIREAIAKIRNNMNDHWRKSEDADVSDPVDIPIIAIDVPLNMECNYISRVENDESQTDYENMARFSRFVQLRDTNDSFSQEETRKIVLGLSDNAKGLVSVDILFRYQDSVRGETISNSVWLQISSVRTHGEHKEIERYDSRQKDIKSRTVESCKRKTTIKPARKTKPIDYDLYEEAGCDPSRTDTAELKYDDFEDHLDIRNRRTIARCEKPSVIREEQESRPEYEDDREIIKPLKPPEPQSRETKSEIKIQDPLISTQKPERTEQQESAEQTDKNKPVMTQVRPDIKPQDAAQPVAPKPASVSAQTEDVNSAVRLLSDIGMSGMTNAASTVNQLSGEEAESPHSQLRTISIEEIKDEISGLGDNIVMIQVKLHGSGPDGEVKGQMQLYLSSQDALDVANELLCNTPDTAIKEFNDDITSTLKETANIFGGQYISAISEYIGVTLSLNAPTFMTGQSSHIAEAELKDMSGKVDFALATNISFGKNKIGHLIMLVDPRSFEIIIQKLS